MKAKLENFWYHYKIPTIIIAAAVVFLTVVGIQIATKQSYDLYVLYAGPVNINDNLSSTATVQKMERGFAALAGDDDLKTTVQSFVWVNDTLAAEYKKNDVYVNATQNRKMLQTVLDAVASGKTPIMLFDPEIYEQVKDLGALEKLSDVMGYQVDASPDGYGVRLGDTALWRGVSGFGDLPADTVLCVRNLQNGFSLVGKTTENEKWSRQLDIFRAMIEYGRDGIE